MKLGTLLLRDGVITLDQLEAALRAQVLYGGKLGTNLVELGHISLDTLATYLGKAMGLPAATKDLFEAASPEAIKALPGDVAQQHVAFPLSLSAGGRTLDVALANPHHQTAIAALESASRCHVQAFVAPELRILFYLERHYGIDRGARYVRVAQPGTRTRPPAPLPERRRILDPLRIIRPRTLKIQPARQPTEAPPATLASVLAELDSAADRDAVGEAICRFARKRVPACVVFLLKEGLAMGWKGFAPGVASSVLSEFAVPLSSPSCLKIAHDNQRPYRAAADVEVREMDRVLLDTLKADPPPAEVAVAPVLIGQRGVNLVYAHAGAGERLEEGVALGLFSLADAAGKAYTRLIQAAKQKHTG